MVVDDNPANLKLLEDMLRQQGHEVLSFPRGRLALAAAERNPPDLILLDINMPEMNGYEVCERLKATEELANIPVIFLSALRETQDKVKAFQSGGADYISKPFHFEEVQARVETHLKLYDLQRALKRQNERLEAAVAARTRELAKANQQLTILDRSKNEFLNLISHELRTPLNGLLGVGELILDGMPGTEENDELKEMFERSGRRLISIMEDALLLTEIDVHAEQFRTASVALSRVLNRARENATQFAATRQVTFSEAPADLGFVIGDQDLLVRAMQALLESAVKFSAEGGTVQMTHEPVGDSLRIIIQCHGGTIPAAAMPKFFDVFSIAEAITAGGDLGLGPALAYRILSLFGGSVSVKNTESGIQLALALKAGTPEGVGN